MNLSPSTPRVYYTSEEPKSSYERSGIKYIILVESIVVKSALHKEWHCLSKKQVNI